MTIATSLMFQMDQSSLIFWPIAILGISEERTDKALIQNNEKRHEVGFIKCIQAIPVLFFSSIHVAWLIVLDRMSYLGYIKSLRIKAKMRCSAKTFP